MDSNELLKRFVAVGVGIGFIARSNTLMDRKAGLLGVMDLADTGIERSLGLIYRKDKSLSRAAKAFIEIAQLAAQQLAPVSHPTPRTRRSTSAL